MTRIVVSSAPKPRNDPEDGIVVRLCDTPLGLNPLLAGLKHLNRLEQVMASAEWNDAAIAEGLMSAVDGRVICATAANVFLVREGTLVTPEIRDCGVAGVMRGVVLAAARELSIFTEVRSYSYLEVRSADLQPDRRILAVPALWTGVLYHPRGTGERGGSLLGARRVRALARDDGVGGPPRSRRFLF